MPIYIQCPKCQRKATVPDTAVGKSVKCGCGTTFSVPAQQLQPVQQQLEQPAEVANEQGQRLQELHAQRKAQEEEDARTLQKLKVVGGICGAILVVALGCYFAFRDTWERDNSARLASLKNDAVAANDAGDVRLADNKCKAIIELVGNRQLVVSANQDAKQFATELRERLAPKVSLIEAEEQKALAAKQAAEQKRLGEEQAMKGKVEAAEKWKVNAGARMHDGEKEYASAELKLVSLIKLGSFDDARKFRIEILAINKRIIEAILDVAKQPGAAKTELAEKGISLRNRRNSIIETILEAETKRIHSEVDSLQTQYEYELKYTNNVEKALTFNARGAKLLTKNRELYDEAIQFIQADADQMASLESALKELLK